LKFWIDRLKVSIHSQQPSIARIIFSSINEYEGRYIPCSDDISIGVGSNDVCPYPGEDVISSLGIFGILENFWVNVAFMIALQVVFRVGAYSLLRRSK
jgi:hypothetical protein